MRTKQTHPTSKPRPVKAPRQRREPRRALAWWLAGAISIVLVGAGILYASSSRDSAQAGAGLPHTPDYHSLLVAADDPSSLILGTHEGLHRSTDGGRTWSSYTLAEQDAMNLERAPGGPIWVAGHLVLARSDDGGETWTDVRPETLPNLDLHGFAVHPVEPSRIYAAVAGAGLYRSDDAGVTFELVSEDVGGAVFGLAVTRDGRILAGDGRRGLLESRDGGSTWRDVLPAAVLGLAVSPGDPRRILATGPGVYLSTDGGATWRRTLEIADGAGPVAWAPRPPGTAYVVGFDRTLRQTRDGGETWTVVD